MMFEYYLSVMFYFPLLRTLSRMNISTWADLTSRSPDDQRTWLDLPALIPDLALPDFSPNPVPWPGDPCSTRPGQFWRLTWGKDEWAWGGIFQISTYTQIEMYAHSNDGV